MKTFTLFSGMVNRFLKILYAVDAAEKKPNELFDKILWEDFDKFIVLYQKDIRHIVNSLSNKFQIDYETRKDLAQWVTMHLIEKKDVLVRRCNRSMDPRTYLFIVSRNKCMEIIRKLKKREKYNQNINDEKPYDLEPSRPLSQLSALAISEQLTRLNAIMTTYSKKRPISELCVKIKIEFPIYENDIKLCFGSLPAEQLNSLLKLSAGLNDMTQQKIREVLAPFFDLLENKKRKTGDFIRKKEEKVINNIVSLLNCGGAHFYDADSLEFLFDQYFFSENSSNSPA